MSQDCPAGAHGGGRGSFPAVGSGSTGLLTETGVRSRGPAPSCLVLSFPLATFF